MIKTLNIKNKIGFSITSISKNISPSNNRNQKQLQLFTNNNTNNNNSTFNNIKLYSTTKYSTNINKNDNNKTRSYYTAVNSQFQNKKYDIMQSIPNSQNLKDIYRILNDVSMSSYFKTANIRISFFNQDRDKCDIKGVKLYGSSNNNGWIVIIGGRDSTQWNNIALSLYLSTLFAEKPLKHFDVIVFPVENPTPITSVNTARRNAVMMSNTLNQIQQSANNSSTSFINGPSTTASSLSQQNNSFFYNSFSTSYNDLEFLPKTKGNHALNEWLNKSKKDFINLNINKTYTIEQLNSNGINNIKSIKPKTGFFDSSVDQFEIYNNGNKSLVLDESNEENSDTQSDFPNFILDIKNFKISPNFSAEELYSLGSNLATQLTDIDRMYSSKKLSPIGF